jgi:thioredoxin
MKKLIILLSYLLFTACQSTSQSIHTISIDEFEKGLKTDSTIQLLDVRTEGEYTGGHLAKSVNMDYNEDEFATQITTLDKSKPTYIYCLSGGRSKNAANQMAKAGFTNIINMDGGIMAWRAGAKSLVTDRPVQNKSMSMETYMAMVNKDKPVLVEFYAPWCGPCKVLKPQVEKIGAENADKMYVQFVNVDDHQALADELKIKSIPILMYYDNGKKKWEIQGAPSLKDLKKKLKI